MTHNTLVIGDTHIPFEHRDYLDFCKRIHKAFNCQRVVHIGDLVDNHAISYHEHDPDGWSPEDEMREADKHLKEWFKAFPKVYMCRGNHDRLVDRKGKTVGLPTRCFASFRTMWNLPDGWKDDFQFILDDVLYTHGDGYSGDFCHLKAALDNRMNVVIGHIHHAFGVAYSANNQDIIMGVSVGCGLDRKKYAFDYGRVFKRKPILGCAVISHSDKGTNATVYPMKMA